MSKVIAICNQKGGVGKTTTAANLGVALVMEGKKVLVIDLDPQSDLSASLGYERTDDMKTTVSTMMGKAINEELFDPMEGVIKTDEGIFFMPSNLELSAMEMSLVGTMNRERVLKAYIDKVRPFYVVVQVQGRLDSIASLILCKQILH